MLNTAGYLKLQRAETRYLLKRATAGCSVLKRAASSCSVLKRATAGCSVLKRAASICSPCQQPMSAGYALWVLPHPSEAELRVARHVEDFLRLRYAAFAR